MAKDVAFQLLPSNFLQTATNSAATVVEGLVAAGFISDADEAVEAIRKVRDELFTDLVAQVEQDNAALKAAFDAAPTKSYGNKGGAKTPTAPSNPGDAVFTWGKFKDKSIAEVAKEDDSYLDWLINKDTNAARNFMRAQAKAYVEQTQAGV
jgi:3'-phosphoadenosine 5'-phosphosulfate sulfotransferase